MPRPKLRSDEEVLRAAHAVLRSRGPADLTIDDVAKTVGLSRAAILQRFGSREALLRRVMERSVATTRDHLSSMPRETGPQALWRFLESLCDVLGAGDRFLIDISIACIEASDPHLRTLSDERQRLVCAAIAARAPTDGPLPPEATAALLHAVLAGATMQWGTARSGRLDDFVRLRLRDALSLLSPQHDPSCPREIPRS